MKANNCLIVIGMAIVVVLSGCGSTPTKDADNSASATTTPPIKKPPAGHPADAVNTMILPGGEKAKIPTPVAPARPSETTTPATDAKNNVKADSPEESAAATPAVIPPTSCATFEKPHENAMVQSGDFLITLLHCDLKGDQLQVSGFIEYSGQENALAAIGTVAVSGPDGTSYPVEHGNFGDSRSFGISYSAESLVHFVPVAFSLEAGPIKGDTPGTVNLVMPSLLGEHWATIVFHSLRIGK